MMNLGIQLYAVREAYMKDMAGTFAKLAEMGYQEVEGFWVYPCRAAEYEKALKDSGLKICGWHTGIEHLEGDRLFPTLEYHDRIGNHILGLNAGPDMLDTPEKIKQLRDRMTAAQEALAKYGFVLEYHNHWWEFESGAYKPLMEGSTVYAQFDIGNALKGGVTAQDYFAKFDSRRVAVHAKPYSLTSGFECTIGNDDVSWQWVIKHCRDIQIEHLTVEYEQPENQMELAKKNIDALKAIMAQV